MKLAEKVFDDINNNGKLDERDNLKSEGSIQTEGT